MTRNDVTQDDRCSLTLAGIRFSLLGAIDAAALAPSFKPFLNRVDAADLYCTVSGLKPDQRLNAISEAPDEDWSFSRPQGRYQVIRRDRQGQAVWQISGDAGFEAATVRWHPSRFIELYGSFERTLSQGIGHMLLTLRLLAHGGLLTHGMAAELDGQGVLCLGISGRGKSTLSRLLDAAGAVVLTDERPVLRQWPPEPRGEGTAFRVYGTPWPSSAGFARNAWAPLKRIYFLEHGDRNTFTPLKPSEVIRRMIPVTMAPWQAPEYLEPVFKTLEALVAHVPCVALAFRPDASAVDDIRRDLGGG